MAASVEVEKMRPNIRIEIPNNITESDKMDVDQEDENEEGEIVDADDVSVENNESQAPTSLNSTRIVISSQKNDIFTTGINIFDKEAQDKLQERAKRFALKPEEIHQFSDTDLAELYESLGITVENESQVRFDAVHMLGVTGMTTEDILEYFAKYAPATIEWINNNSCNVTWLENIAAARAMFYSSKAVQGMPAREPENVFAKEFLDDIDDQENTGKSILLKNREVELKVDDILPSSKLNFKNAVDMSEITIPIPPGYWRLGEKHSKTKCILLRYSLKTDQQPYTTENFSKYYKKLGTSKGIISESRKKELKGIFERNKHLNQTKNPWGSLAKNWNHDARFREPERGTDPQIEIKNPSLLVRLGKKKEFPQEEVVEDKSEEDDDVQIVESTKSKGRVPRMRMYADEEEEKVRRRKLIQTIKKHTDTLMRTTDLSRTKDLRNVLRMNNKVGDDEVIVLDNDSDEYEDLGTRLKNRTRHMVFAVGRDIEDEDIYERKENRSSDARHLLDHRRAQSPHGLYSRRSSSRSPIRRYRSRSPIMRYRSPARRSARSSRHRRSHEKTLHSDKMPSRRHHRRRRHSEERDAYSGKPRSRVAVVVRKPKKPTVPSTIWSRVRKPSGSEEESSSEESEESSEDSEESSSSSSSSSSSEESESESESGSSETDRSDRGRIDRRRKMERPGFRGRSALANQHKTPLKITMSNDRYGRPRK